MGIREENIVTDRDIRLYFVDGIQDMPQIDRIIFHKLTASLRTRSRK